MTSKLHIRKSMHRESPCGGAESPQMEGDPYCKLQSANEPSSSKPYAIQNPMLRDRSAHFFVHCGRASLGVGNFAVETTMMSARCASRRGEDDR